MNTEKGDISQSLSRSDSRHLALEQTRLVLSLLRKSEIGPSDLTIRLKALQQSLRYGCQGELPNHFEGFHCSMKLHENKNL